MENILHSAMVWSLPLLFAITLHEAAHAFAAWYFGDATAYLAGRMTLNPLKHIDLLGTVVIPLALLVAGSTFIFGYAKPVPIHFGNLKNPRRDSALVALAGPAANLLMALGWAVVKAGFLYAQTDSGYLIELADAGILINLVLFAFNLFPLPPLDGGRIMTSMLPYDLAYKFSRIEPYGFFIVLALVYLGLTSYWMRPLMWVGRMIINLILSPLLYFLPV